MPFFTKEDTNNLSSDLKRSINGREYWHISLIHGWSKNETYRITTDKGWLRLLKSLKKYGVREPFQIDPDGIVYDGNNRYKGSKELISKGITTADNKKSLEWVPVIINKKPTNETEELAIAVRGNGDKDFAIWNKDALADHEDMFKQIDGLEDFVIDTYEAETFNEVFEEFVDDNEDEKPEKKKKDECLACKEYHERNHIQ